MTAAEYLAFSKGLVQILTQFDPVFGGLIIHGDDINQKIADDLGDFDEHVFNYMNDEENCTYANPDRNNRKLTLDSTCRPGFHIIFSNKKSFSDFTLMISCGSKRLSRIGLIDIGFPSARQAKYQDYEHISRLMKLVIEYCQPDNAFMSYGRIDGQRKDEIKLEYESEKPARLTMTHPIGWLNYFRDPEVKSRLPADLDTEMLATGGTLIALKRSLPTADNKSDVATAIRIRNALMQPYVIDVYPCPHQQ